MEHGGPSQTARRVAAHRLDFTRVPADYGDPAADHALAVDVASGRQAPASRMHDYLAARTAFFDRTVTGALGRGVTQVVVGAAGYDGRAFHLYHELTGTIERRWHDRFTPGVTGALRASLEPLAAGQPPVLFGGLEPYPDNWRASVRRPATLPHFPMVLHRGGYPDGS